MIASPIRSGRVEAKSGTAAERSAPSARPFAGGAPARFRLGRELLGGVVEDHHLVDRGVVADGRDDRGEPLALGPDLRRVVERVADRRGLGQELVEALPGRCGERRQGEPDAVGLVGGDAGVAARAGQEREAAGAVGTRPRLGEDPRELEQLVRVAGPAGTRLLDQGPEDPLVAGERAGVGGRRPGAGLGGADLEHDDADPALGAVGQRGGEPLAVAVLLEEHRDRADAVGGAERAEPVARRRRRPDCRSRRPCESRCRAATRAR